MIERIMLESSEYDTKPSEYAGQERAYKNGKVMVDTETGNEVVIIDYLQDKGLYVVTLKKDEAGTISPSFKINPDRLEEKEEKK